MSNQIVIRPLVTEKASLQADKKNKYSFVVHKTANKIQIKTAVEAQFGVTVEDVNTLVVPAKTRMRFSNGRQTQGRKPGYKKAIVTVAQGEFINVYGEQN
jgi:large subunit ribosomal protein L23